MTKLDDKDLDQVSGGRLEDLNVRPRRSKPPRPDERDSAGGTAGGSGADAPEPVNPDDGGLQDLG